MYGFVIRNERKNSFINGKLIPMCAQCNVHCACVCKCVMVANDMVKTIMTRYDDDDDNDNDVGDVVDRA